MCGIAGVVGPGADAEALERALTRLWHRGPDDGRVSAGEGYAIGYRRLAIRAVGARADQGRQPFRSRCGRVTLYGVGEVYNVGELARPTDPVAPAGGDIGTLLAVYLREGIAGLAAVRGEFALVIRDERDGSTILARDTAGIKPLFHSVREGRLHFASEVKGLAALGVPLAADPASLAAYLRFNYPVPPRTFYDGVSCVPPGTALVWRDGTLREVPFATLEQLAGRLAGRPAPEHREVAEALRASVTARLAGDVPLGFHLSGGVDSSLVCALAGRAGAPAYTMSYDSAPDAGEGDAVWAARVAAEQRMTHRTLGRTEEDALAEVDRYIGVLDSPVMSPGALTPYFVAEAARRDGVPVLLAGQGSDEVFLGYRRHEQAAGARPADLAGIASNVDADDLHTVAPAWREAFTAADSEITALAGPAADLPPLAAFQLLYLRSFLQELLRIEDHAHMARSVENRPPFLDTDVLGAGLLLTAHQGEAALGKPALHKILSELGSVAAQRGGKQQMAVTMEHAGRWARAVLTAPEALDVLDLCDRDAVRGLLAAPTTRRQDRLLWALANLVRWSTVSGVALT
jgi:asparagine synthase (glutamine-hydrolysing)